MKLVISAEARHDLARIGDIIARDNPVRALSFIDELQDRCRSLVAFPLAYPVVSRDPKLGIRRLVHGKYLVFYRVSADEIVVIHILPGRMNIDDILALDQ
jgi:toxin ParE1/3/4